jgi:hypothetical protein
MRIKEDHFDTKSEFKREENKMDRTQERNGSSCTKKINGTVVGR